MSDSIAALTDDQAIAALKLVFNFSDPQLWSGEEKPTDYEVGEMATALVKNAPADIQPAVAALAGQDQTDGTSVRARVSRLILAGLSPLPAFGPLVAKAVNQAREPNRFAIDPLTGGFVLLFLLATTKIEHSAHGVQIKFGGGAVDAIREMRIPELLHELPDVIKALPEGVWSAMKGGIK